MGGPPDESQDAGQLASRKVGDVLVISLSGRIVAGASTDAFRELVENSVELGAAKILVDMSAVTFIDSSGIGELVHAFLRARKAGGQLRLTRLSEKILDLMRMTHLDKVMDIENDEAQALAAFAS
jgi:anti-sigma B factor antagonist